MTEIESLRGSVVQYKIGSRTYDMVQSRNCGTCMHPARFQIEQKLLENYGFPAISRFVSNLNKQRRDGSVEEWPELTTTQIRNHYRSGHCPIEGETLRALADERAKERGIELTDSSTQYLDSIIYQKAVLHRGFDMLMRGEISPDVKDTLAASKMLADAEAIKESGASVDQWQEFMSIYFQQVQRVVSDQQWQEIVTGIRQHPAFNEMNAINNRETIEAEVIDE